MNSRKNTSGSRCTRSNAGMKDSATPPATKTSGSGAPVQRAIAAMTMSASSSARTSSIVRIDAGIASEARAGLAKERDLLGRRCAAEDLVTVRVASEAADDRGVLLGPDERLVEAGLAREARGQLERTLLRGGALRVLERQVDEPSLERVEVALESRVDCAA